MSLDLNLGDSWNYTSVPVYGLKRSAFVTSEDSGTLVKLSDVLSPLDKPTSLKITNTRIANVYNTLAKGTVPLGNQAQNTSGQAIFSEATITASEVVDGKTVIVPIVARVEIRVPNYGSITDGIINSAMLIALAGTRSDDGSTSIVSQQMRGILYPGG